jgi:hypothetical protein
MISYVYVRSGHKKARPVKNRKEYLAIRNTEANAKNYAAARAGDKNAKARLKQFNYNDLLPNGVLKGCCKVKNTGSMAGTEVVQLYVGFDNSKVDRPVKILRGFRRVDLAPGEEKEVVICCPVEKLAYYNAYTREMEVEHMVHQVYIGTSSDNRDLLRGTVEI